jgi:hypothetical protein
MDGNNAVVAEATAGFRRFFQNKYFKIHLLIKNIQIIFSQL